LVGIGAACAKVVMNVVLVPLFEAVAGNGTVGGAIGTVLTETLMLIVGVTLVPKHVLAPSIAWYALRAVLAGALAALGGLALLQFSVFLTRGLPELFTWQAWSFCAPSVRRIS
jgi:Na+-driven multidrug efflux pump